MILRTQLFRFGCVGCLAALVNMCLLYYLVTYYFIPPLWANAVAFVVAFQVSFWGHRYWSFSSSQQVGLSLVKFLLVAVISFLANESLYAFFLYHLHFHYLISLICVLCVVPPLTFLFSKIWAFR